VVAGAAYRAGAPEGLFGCLTEVTLPGTDALLEDDRTDVILATGGTAMVRAAYSKGKPAYGVGSGNVPVWVDRSADVPKAAADVITGASFDWGTLCSTERSVVADAPIRARLVEEMKRRGAHFCSADEADKLRRVVKKGGGLNVEVVGQAPAKIAAMAGFSVPGDTQALVAEVTAVGREEPLSMETLSPILSFYTADGWEAGCARCIEVLEYGGIGHTLALHAGNARVVEQFALRKPSMRIVVNTVAALGSVGMTTALFPAMTLGPGTLGGSIISDNVSPLHLLNVKRVAFETAPLNPPGAAPRTTRAPQASKPAPPKAPAPAAPRPPGDGGWMDVVEARLRERAGSPPPAERPAPPSPPREAAPAPLPASASVLPLPEAEIEALVRRFRTG
jgi:acetaldehyde dehydrogenase (acetylating)